MKMYWASTTIGQQFSRSPKPSADFSYCYCLEGG